jgi:pantoate kinase
MGKIEKENGKGDLMANKIKRMSQKEYTIHKMEKCGLLTSKILANEMRKWTTEEVNNVFEKLKKSKHVQKMMKKVI